jgi:hypothetical protein
MANNNGSDSNSGAQTLLERLQKGFLEALGGQDLRNSGFEDEGPDPEFSGREEPWHG